MKLQKHLLSSGLIALSALCLLPQAHAGLLDELLKNPTIQGLITRPDLGTLDSACLYSRPRFSGHP